MPFLTPLFKAFFATFGVMDPVGNVPTFLSLTEKMDPKARDVLAGKAVATAGGILLVFTFLGNAILDASLGVAAPNTFDGHGTLADYDIDALLGLAGVALPESGAIRGRVSTSIAFNGLPSTRFQRSRSSKPANARA